MDMDTFNYISGRAGTGKSFLLKDIAAGDSGSTLTATTGIAAVNLGGEARTLNSLLWYYNLEKLQDNFTSGALDTCLGYHYRKGRMRRILVDEVSMLSGEELSLICKGIDRLNNTVEEPMGITLAGDFAQLPPVSGKFAFEVASWERFEDNTIILDEIRRQTDKEFIEALAWVRSGEGKKAAEFFEQYMNPLPDARFEGSTLYGTNILVDRMNNIRLGDLKTEEITYKNYRKGKERPEWKKYIPKQLDLKIGALVMMLANKKSEDGGGQLEFANGDLGYIESKLNTDVMMVRLIRNKQLVEVERINRKNEKRNKKGKLEVLGEIDYMPVRLAYAITIHKSQGLSLDRVQVAFNSKFIKATPGMLYVALSRARTAEGLRLVGGPKTFAKACTYDERIRRWL